MLLEPKYIPLGGKGEVGREGNVYHLKDLMTCER